MLNIVVADDEKTIRDGLAKYIPWESMGFQLVAVCESAEEVLEYMKHHTVHVVLTDIVMDGMSGLELLQKIEELSTEVYTILLSGYDDFEYARTAVRLGACDYLTKPLNLEELKKCLLKIKVNFESQEQITKLREQNTILIQEQYLNHLIKGEYEAEQEAVEEGNRTGIQAVKRPILVIRVVIDCLQHDLQRKLGLIKKLNWLGNHLEDETFLYAFNNTLDEIAMVVFGENKNQDIMKKIIKTIKEDITGEFFIGVSGQCDWLLEMKHAYKHAGDALEYRTIKRFSNVIYYTELSEYMKGPIIVSEHDEEAIFNFLDQKDEQGLMKYVMKIISVLSENDLDHYKFIYDICIEVFLLIKKYIDANIGKTEEFEEETFNSIRNLLHQNSLEDIEDALKKFFKRSILIIQRSSEVMENTIVANAKQYINEHFGEHVTLSTIAKAVYVHPIYLSKLFKDKTGENFIDYLTNVRMKKAKELLKNPSFKIYDISYMVGYESSKHFSKVFKDETGMTPREYRNKSL